MLRLLIILLASCAFALDPNPNWEYPCADTLPVADIGLRTIPASDSIGYPRGGTVYVLTPRVCRSSYPEAWYGTETGQGSGAIGNACFYVQGQEFHVEDSVGAAELWTIGFGFGSSGEWRDTVALPLESLDVQTWVDRPLDTLYFRCDDLDILTGITDDARFIYACDSVECDTCAFIVFCDTLFTGYGYDTLKFTRDSLWPPFYQVEWFIRQATADSFYIDTLIYVTAGDTKFSVYRSPVIFNDTSSSGSVTVSGWRSAGMDVWCDNGKVVSSVDSLEYGLSHIPFDFSWSGFSHKEEDTLRVWGVSYNGVHSDTIRIRRQYINSNYGTFRRR